MIANDCAICCDEVTKATGRSVMSCGHEFHMRCLVQWLQKPDGTGNCPCCRAEPGEKERLMAPPVDSDSESESDDSDSDFSDDPDSMTIMTPLMTAARDGNLAELQRIIREGTNIEEKDSDGDTALIYAVIYKEHECAEALIAAGADLTSLASLISADTTNSALIAACRYNSLPVATAAIARGAILNDPQPTTGITPLMEAVRSDSDKALVDLLLAKGASVTAVDSDGWNVFMWFTESACDGDIMSSLLSATGSVIAPRTEHAVAVKKIQALWRGWKVRRLRLKKTVVTPSWFMNRMMTVV